MSYLRKQKTDLRKRSDFSSFFVEFPLSLYWDIGVCIGIAVGVGVGCGVGTIGVCWYTESPDSAKIGKKIKGQTTNPRANKELLPKTFPKLYITTQWRITDKSGDR